MEYMSNSSTAKIRTNPDFIHLVRSRSTFAWVLTVIMLLIYYGFVFLVAFAPGSMATNVGGQITLGFPLGLFVILSAIVLTGVYVVRANGHYDALTQKIVQEARR